MDAGIPDPGGNLDPKFVHTRSYILSLSRPLEALLGMDHEDLDLAMKQNDHMKFAERLLQNGCKVCIK